MQVSFYHLSLGKSTLFSERTGEIMRNPNHYGSVVKLSGRRRRPFMVRGGVYAYDDRGYPKFDIIGYAATREEGNIMLAEYNRDPWDVDRAKITLKELFELWQDKRATRLGKATQASMRMAFKHCAKLMQFPYRQIKAYQMQDTIDNCGHGYSTQAAIKAMWGHLDRFALELDVVTRCYSELLTSDPVPETTRERFSDDEIAKVWDHSAEPWIDTVLIFLYSGWRISELLDMKKSDVDLQAGTMKGGTKTRAGKNRIVPIHSLIRPYIVQRMELPGEYLITYKEKRCSEYQYRVFWNDAMKRLGIKKTPHECRHTFESLLDSAGANRKCIDLMMGHVSKDTGNRVYNHKTLEDLRLNLELVTR